MASRFKIETCTVEDAPAIARNNMLSFWTDPAWRLQCRDYTLDEVIQRATRKMPMNLLKESTIRRHFKAVDVDSGAVAGYIRWVLPDTPNAAQQWTEAKVPKVSAERFEEAKAAASKDWELYNPYDEIDEAYDAMMEKYMKIGKKHLLLDMVAVQPEYHRRGIGSLLAKTGIEKAEKLGLDIFVHAKRGGLALYERLGFKVVHQVVMDDAQFGGTGDGDFAAYFLVKEVTSPEQKT